MSNLAPVAQGEGGTIGAPGNGAGSGPAVIEEVTAGAVPTRSVAEGEAVRTHYRHLGVLPRFVGKTVSVYTGKEFQDVTVMPEMSTARPDVAAAPIRGRCTCRRS